MDEKNNTQGMLDMGVAPGNGGKDLFGIIDGGIEKGEIRCLYVMGSDLLQLPNRNKVAAALEAGVSGCVGSVPNHHRTTCPCCLPAATAAEKAGSFTTTDNRTQSFTAAASAPGEARPDLVILGTCMHVLSAVQFSAGCIAAGDQAGCQKEAGASGIGLQYTASPCCRLYDPADYTGAASQRFIYQLVCQQPVGGR